MCGICGIYNFHQEASEEDLFNVNKMMSMIKHRGPDADGFIQMLNNTFGFVRLSILDLTSEGNQPMTDESGRYTIVFNGEIYNYIELRDELKKDGFIFRSNCDTEILLHAYIKWKENALEKFNGMFAFAIYDNIEKSLFLARDRYGIKPLYYYKSDDRIVFCSEILPIVNCCISDKKVNNDAVYNYLVYNRTDYDTSTFFNSIQKVQHGSYIKITKGDYKEQRWYDLKNRIENYEPGVLDFRNLFKSSLNFRLRSDVPVGLCLSGGLDSSAIASVLINDFNKKDLNTFSAVYSSDFAEDEKRYIDTYSKDLENMYYITPDHNTLFQDKEKFISAIGEPIPSTSPYAQYKVMELASKNVTVTLDGQGADEELGGYHYFFGIYFKELLKKFRLLKLASELLHYYKNHKSFYGYKSFIFFLLNPSLMDKARQSEKGYLKKEYINSVNDKQFISGNLYKADTLNESLYRHFEYKLEHLLKWEDRNSMHFSIEARLPFLDYRIVEHLLNSSSNEKIYKGTTKHILRESVKDILPREIYSRQTKVGFDTPDAQWFREKVFSDFINDILRSSSFRNRGFFDSDKCKEIYNRHLKKEISVPKEIWKWINLEIWYRMIEKL